MAPSRDCRSPHRTPGSVTLATLSLDLRPRGRPEWTSCPERRAVEGQVRDKASRRVPHMPRDASPHKSLLHFSASFVLLAEWRTHEKLVKYPAINLSCQAARTSRRVTDLESSPGCGGARRVGGRVGVYKWTSSSIFLAVSVFIVSRRGVCFAADCGLPVSRRQSWSNILCKYRARSTTGAP